MHFEYEFQVPGTPALVLARFTDMEKMAGCMPGAAIEGREEDGAYSGTMLVSFGPKKIKFRGKVTNEVDCAASEGRLQIRGAADMRSSARVDVHVRYTVRAIANAPNATSVIYLISDAKLGGVLADFGRTGGLAVTRALMDVFAQRVARELAEPTVAFASPEGEILPTDPKQAAQALSAVDLLLSVVASTAKRLFEWLANFAKRRQQENAGSGVRPKP